MDPSQILEIIDSLGALFYILYFGFIILMIASQWRIFTKAGQPGWAVLVPIYSFIIYLKVIKKPISWLWIVLGLIVACMIPFVNFIAIIAILVVDIILLHELSKVFGKGVGYTVGLIFLGFVFLPMLAFGDAKYIADGEEEMNQEGAVDQGVA